MKKLLILGYVWPEPKSSAAGARMMQLIQLFLSADFEIVYATPAQKTDFSENVNSLGIQEISIQINDSSVDQVLQEIAPTHVLFDRFMMEEQLGWRISENCPNAVKILDTEDLHFLRKARQKAHQEKKPFTKSGLFTDQAKREIASILRCDLSLIISEAEMQILLNNFDIKPQQVFYLPFLLKKEQINSEAKRKNFSERKDFVSIGNFLHPPNWDQVLYLKTEIWPLIRKELPTANVEIYGAYPSAKVKQLHNKKQGFLVKGRAENAEECIAEKRILLAPLRFGAGLKGKLIDAMLVGTPSITTTIGAEGMCGELPWAGEIANTAEEFAKQAVLKYANEKRWMTAQKNGYKILRNRFLYDRFKDAFLQEVEFITDNLTQHRNQNFIGQILQQQSLNSSKYMSLWIEEKNK